MAVLFLQRPEISDSQWNTFLASSPQRIVYAYSWYLDVVSPDWSALVLEEKGGWKAVMPLPVRKKWGFRVIQQPFFCQLLGVFTHSTNESPEIDRMFLETLPDHFSYLSLYTGRFSKGLHFPEFCEIGRCATHTLSLHLSYPQLRKNYSSDRRLNAIRAQKWDWEITESRDLQPLIDLFQKHHAARIDGGVAESAYQLLQKAGNVLFEKKAARLVYALREGKIEAGALFAFSDNRIIYLFNAASPLGRKGNARTLFIDRMIREYAGTDFIFDFESPEVASIADFYRSFGAEAEVYWQLHYNRLP
jgi:hypothetical protein